MPPFPTRIRRFTAAWAICLLGLLTLTGCEKEVDLTETNLQAAWQASFGDAQVTFSLYPDNTFEVVADPDGPTSGQQLYAVSGFSAIPPLGEWRLAEDEIVFSEKGRTVGGLQVIELTAGTALLKADDGGAMYFVRTNLPGTSAFGAGGIPTDWDEDEDEDFDLGLDD